MIRAIFLIIFSFFCIALFAKNYGNIEAKYINNYDGDTITVDINNYPPIIGDNITVRIKGIDTPEIKSKNKKDAIKAKGIVRDLLVRAHKIELRNIERDKYFRILADVYADDINISQVLIDKHLAVKYDGGNKVKAWEKK